MNQFSEDWVVLWVGCIGGQVDALSWKATCVGLSSIVWLGWFYNTKISWFEARESKTSRSADALQKGLEVDFCRLIESEGGWHGFRLILRPSFSRYSLREAEEAPCDALCRFAHLGSETVRKRAKQPARFKISISGCSESRTRVDSLSPDSQIACPANAPTACLTTRPTRLWKRLGVDGVLCARRPRDNCEL